jgi:putative pyrroloquinoline-quinone binding quinoprotein
MQASGDIVTCTYCGTESRVQRRTQLFQRPIDLPPIGPSQPRTVALQRSNTARWIALGALLAIAALASAVFTANLPRGPDALPPLPSPAAAPIWTTSHPLLVDLDRDGFEDAIGFVRSLQPRDIVRIRAISGATGKALWETPPLGAYEHHDRSELVLAQGLVLLADTEYKPRLEAYDASTGARRWSITPGEVVMDLCRAGDGRIKLVTKDEIETSIELATGAASPLAKRSSCVRLPSTDARVVTYDTNNRHWGFAPPGMQSNQIVGDPSSWILSGAKSPGTAIPMLAVIDDREHLKWKSQLASTDPMSSKGLMNQFVAYDATLVATVYGRKDDKQPPVLVAFDRERGTRLFETILQRKGSWFLTGIALEVGPTAVWVAIDDGVRAYDRKTGALRWHMAN